MIFFILWAFFILREYLIHTLFSKVLPLYYSDIVELQGFLLTSVSIAPVVEAQTCKMLSFQKPSLYIKPTIFNI